MNLLGFGSRPVDIVFTLKEEKPARHVKQLKLDDKVCHLPIYYDREDIVGKVAINFKKSGSRLDHQGIRIEFIGHVDSANERSSPHEFVALSKLLAYPGDLSSNTVLDFSFIDAEKPYESYYGLNVKLRYFLKLTIIKRFANIVEEEDIYVQEQSKQPNVASQKISMEVGIEDSLHIEFEYLKSSFHLTDVIVGKIYFALVRIKIKYMELNLMRKETVGSFGNVLSENEIITKYEILDGAPTKGETVPIRLFLAPFDLTPTMKDVLNKFSVNYALNLNLVDEEDRRYFKQQDIILWRKPESEFLKCKDRLYKMVSIPQDEIESSEINGHTEHQSTDPIETVNGLSHSD